MTERINGKEDKENRPISLADVDEGVVLPAGKLGEKRRKRFLSAVLAMIILLGGSGIGGYLLLRGKQVELKANKRLEEKRLSGADIRKAAYDSLSASLSAPSPTPSIVGATINGASESASSNDVQTKSQFPEIVNEKSGSASIQPGIQEALAPPPGFLPSKASPMPDAKNERSEQISRAVASMAAGKSAISKSVRFAPVTEGEQSAKSNPNLQIRREDVAENRKTDAFDPQTVTIKRSGHRSILPSFGAMLPVRSLGALYTLRTGSVGRFELTRDLEGDQWRMRRGTIFIGTVTGGDKDRAYLQIKGYIDPDTERLVKIEGELLGDDGAAGLRGKGRRVSPAWVKALDRAAQAGVQIATGILNSRASSVIIASDPYGAVRAPNESQSNSNRSFVEVPAGAIGFVMVTTLPEPEKSESHLAESSERKDELADRDLAALITSAEPARIREALPKMSPELRQIAQLMLNELEATGK
jgi:hypothetical protein